MPWRSNPQDRHEQFVQKSNILIFQLPHFQFSNCQCCCWNVKLSVKVFPLFLTSSQADSILSVLAKSGTFLTPFPQVRCWVILTYTHVSKNQEIVTLSDPRAPALALSSHFGISKTITCLLVDFSISKTLFVEHRLMLFWCFHAYVWIGKPVWALEAENTHPW